MKKIFQIVFIFFLNLTAGNAQNLITDTSFIISGSVSGIADGTEVLLENPNNNTVFSKTKIEKGTFTLKGKLNEPELFWLKVAGETPQYIYVENNKINVTGSKPLGKNFNVSGSSSHYDFSIFQVLFNPLIFKLQSIVPAINNSPVGYTRDSLMEIYKGVIDSIQLRVDQYVSQFPKSYVTPFILFVTTQFYEDILLLEKRFNKVDSAIRLSQIGTSLNDYIVRNKIGAVGTEAIDFIQPDTTGNMISLNSFKGKFVLVDFWASWCGPCRMENPNVVENFHRFKDKNFTVLGVSLDRPGQKDKWIEAIHKDNLTWSHVSDLQHWNNAAAKLYNVSGIPFNILVDPKGMIVARNLRGPDLESKLCELLGCN